MKVVLVNGSPHTKGCTYTALEEVALMLQAEGIETEMFQLGTDILTGCIGCGVCAKTGLCFRDDKVNQLKSRIEEFDGFVFGSPVHYAAASGSLTSFLDRLFYGSGAKFAHKVGASVVSCRRGGASAAFDQLNKYFTICNMMTVGSQYWNQVHGTTPDEVRQDAEGMQTMRTLGRNMAWLLKSIEAGRLAGIETPEPEARTATNFIR